MRYTLKAVFDDRDPDRQAPDGLRAGYTNGDEARAGYRFGRDMHNNDRYRHRSWNEADADLEVLWNARDPAANWEECKAAVHLGWDSTSPEIDDDSDRRSHWRSSRTRRTGDGGAQHADRMPAPEAASDPDAAWKRRHPGELPPWERFIDAVRHGWGRISAGMDSDETDYRVHHAGHYPGTDYNDLAPVYRYGRHVRDRAAFRGRDWNDVEGELRLEWERGCKEGKPSTWDEMKAALQQGWKHGEH